MTDRELLELAAKAAGYEIDEDCDRLDVRQNSGAPTPWSPLEDDGDAFRLMVGCGLDAGSCGDLVWADPWKDDETAIPTELAEGDGEPKLVATRRAIVRAAAAMGEGK